MGNSASITVTNHRLKKAMSQVNDDDLTSHTKKMGDKLKSELKLQIGEVIELYPDTETCKVKIDGKTETCLIAHNTFSEGMSVVGYPKGKTKIDHKLEVITPSGKLYGVICTVDYKGKDEKVLLSYVNKNKGNNLKNTKAGEYKIQVGDNIISLTDNHINIKGEKLYINGLPYTEAYKPLENYHDKEEINEIKENIETRIDNIVDIIYPVGSVYMSINNANPKILFGGEWERIEDHFLLGTGGSHIQDYYFNSSTKEIVLDYSSGEDTGDEEETSMESSFGVYMWKRIK